MPNIKVILTPGQRAILEEIRDNDCTVVDCDRCPVDGLCTGFDLQDVSRARLINGVLKAAEE